MRAGPRCLAIAEKVDVVIENFRTGVAERRGLAYAQIKAVNPAAIYCSISGYGRDGQYAGRAGYDPVVQAESGMMSLTGEADGAPMRTGIPFVDIGAGLYAAQAITAALYQREKTGQGRQIEVALYDVGISFLANYAMTYLSTGEDPKRVGNSNQIMHPVGIYQARDADFMLTVASNALYDRLCREVLRRPDLLSDPHFAAAGDRVKNRAALTRELNGVFATKARRHWLESLEAAGIPAGRVRTVGEAIDADESKARHLFRPAEHPEVGIVQNLSSPMSLSDNELTEPTAAPLLGQHTADVLRDLAGYDEAQIQALDRTGIARLA